MFNEHLIKISPALGNYLYLHTGKPSLNISLDSMMVQPNYVSKINTNLYLLILIILMLHLIYDEGF